MEDLVELISILCYVSVYSSVLLDAHDCTFLVCHAHATASCAECLLYSVIFYVLFVLFFHYMFLAPGVLI